MRKDFLFLSILVGLALLTTAAQEPSGSLMIRSGLQGGDAQMESDFPYQYVPVREIPPGVADGLRRTALRLPKPPANISPDRPVNGRPLLEVKGEAGPLLLPSYLPEGFSYERAFVAQRPRDPRVKTKLPPVLIFSGPPGRHGTHLHISTASPPPKEMWPLRAELKEGAFKPISRGTITGYLIRGCWGATIDPSSGSINVGWMEDAGLDLVFMRDGQVVNVFGTPTSAFTEEELIKVAESLRPY